MQTRINIPKHIKKIINQRGFYFYEWISQDEIKMVIQRDFFILGMIMAGVTCFICFYLFLVSFGSTNAINGLTYALGMSIIAFMLGLIIIGGYRVFYFIRSSYVLLTDNSIMINGIIYYEDEFDQIQKDIESIENHFDERLFHESKLKESYEHKVLMNKGFFNQTVSTLFDSAKETNDIVGYIVVTLVGICIFIPLYFLFLIISGWVFLIIGIFASIFLFLDKYFIQTLIGRMTIINNRLIEIDKQIQAVIDMKNTLIDLVNGVGNNQWDARAIEEINISIEKFGNSIKIITDNIEYLEKKFHKKTVRETTDFKKLKNWLKYNIHKPLDKLYKLLSDSYKDTENLVKNTKTEIDNVDGVAIETWKIQKMRGEQQLIQMKEVLSILEIYLQKLQP